MKKSLQTLLILIIAILVVSGCSSSNKTSDQNKNTNKDKDLEEELTIATSLEGEITFWNFLPNIYDEVIVEFNKVYPNIKVNQVAMGWEMNHKLQTELAADNSTRYLPIV